MNVFALLLGSRISPRYPSVWGLFFVLLAAVACSPKDERPGLWLQGDEITTTVRDWRFTDEIEEIAIETRAWYLLAHSTTIWCVQHEGNLYVGSYGTEKKFWEKNIARDPRAKIRIEDKIYSAVITLVEDSALSQQLDSAYNQKYDMEEVFGAELIPPWWFYRIEQQL